MRVVGLWFWEFCLTLQCGLEGNIELLRSGVRGLCGQLGGG